MKKNFYLVVMLCLFIAGLSFGQATVKIPHGRVVNFNYTESKTFPEMPFTPRMSMTQGKL